MASSLLVQYILVRGDLIKTLKWPLGAIIAQACHASVAVTHLFYEDEHTREYLQNLDHMHKVVLEVILHVHHFYFYRRPTYGCAQFTSSLLEDALRAHIPTMQ